MIFFAYFRAHGLKLAHARNKAEAETIFTRRAGGIAPDWVERCPHQAFANFIHKMARLGWHGTRDRLALDWQLHRPD